MSLPPSLDSILPDSASREHTLREALKRAPFDGWNDRMLRDAGHALGLHRLDIARLFPHGARDCVSYFFTRSDDALAALAGAQAKRVPDRIEALLMARFTDWRATREAVRAALAFQHLPWHAGDALRTAYRSVDTMWRLANDTSLDINFYTKRLTLAAIYSKTTLIWLNDDTPDLSDTRAFIKRELARVAAFGQWKKKLGLR